MAHLDREKERDWAWQYDLYYGHEYGGYRAVLVWFLFHTSCTENPASISGQDFDDVKTNYVTDDQSINVQNLAGTGRKGDVISFEWDVKK